MFDQAENLRNAILKQKARLAEIEATLNRVPVRHVRWGMESKVSPNSRQRLQEDRIHLQERIAELENELLLQQYHASWNDPSARAAIEQTLAQRETPVRKPNVAPQRQPRPLNKSSLKYRSPLKRAVAFRLAQEQNATDRQLC